MENMLPLPTALSTFIFPECSLTIFSQIVNPTSPFSHLFCSEEGIEDPLFRFFRDSNSSIVMEISIHLLSSEESG